MSAVPAEPIALITPELQPAPYSRPQTRPELKPIPSQVRPGTRTGARTKPKTAVRKKQGISSGTLFVLRATMFVSIGGLTWASSSLSGQVLTESARREGIRAHERATVAQKAEASLRRSVELLTDDDGIRSWAKAHGMVRLDGLDNPTPAEKKGVVALIR